MIAIILAAERQSEAYGLDAHLPLPLFPLGDRPFLHHVVDLLVSLGIRHFEFILGHVPEKLEKYLGDGSRWGASFTFHLLSSASDPLALAHTIANGTDQDILLARGDTLPSFQLCTPAAPTLYLSAAGEWTGWAVLPQATRSFQHLDERLANRLEASCGHFREEVVQQLSFRSVQEVLPTQRQYLSSSSESTHIRGRQIKPGIWIARNVSLHPGVELEAPVYIGPNCRIGSGSRIGPLAVIGEGCIIEGQSLIANALIAHRTYVGQGLELEDVIIDRNRIVNTRLDTGFLVSDSFLLSGLKRQKRPRVFRRLASRLLAFAVFLLLLPLASLTLLSLILLKRGQFAWRKAIEIPTTQDSHMWSEHEYLQFSLADPAVADWWTAFAAEVWLGLIAVMKGELFLAGVKARTRQEVERLPEDWRSLYLASKAGLITEAEVMFGRNPSQDELYTADAYYTAVQSARYDLKLICLYLRKFFSDGARASTDDFGGNAVDDLMLGERR